MLWFPAIRLFCVFASTSKRFLLFIFSKITTILPAISSAVPQALVSSDGARFQFEGGGVCSKTQAPSKVPDPMRMADIGLPEMLRGF